MPHAPPSRHPSAARAGRRRALAALAAAALVLPGAARAATKTFSANSLIIPVQIEYQEDTGIVAAYGLVYTILLKNPERIAAGKRPVTFHWAIAPNKLSQHRCNTNTGTVPSYGSKNDNDGCDFSVQLDSGSPVALLSSANVDEPLSVYQTSYTVAGGSVRGAVTSVDASRTTMKYLGGAWIVDATDRQAFIEMLGEYETELAQYRNPDPRNPKYVKIHSAKTSFTAPIARILNQKPPRIAIVDTTGASFLVEVLEASGLDKITNWDAASPNGVVFELVSAAALLDSDAAFPKGRLNATEGTGASARNRYGLIWIPDGGFTMNDERAANLKWFVDSGFGAYVEASSIESVENFAGSRLHSLSGINRDTSNIAYYEDCTDRELPPPPASMYGSTETGSCFAYGMASQPYAQTGNFPFQGGQGNYKGFTPNSGLLPGVDRALRLGDEILVSAHYKDNDDEKGLVFYMAGHKFENGRFWGQRLIMNSVVTNVPLLVGTELARSEPTGYKNLAVDPPTKRVYQGTYVQLPEPPSSDLETYNPAAPQRWLFPFTQGHLYEHDLETDISSTGQTFGANKNWDAADRVPAPGDRQIFTFLDGSAHLGWKRVNFFHEQITATTCTDADGDGKCDLAKALAACGTAGITADVLAPKTDTSAAAIAQRNTLGMFVQQVRGHCAARDASGAPNFTPASYSDCLDHRRQDNVARLGGIDHGSPAIVGASRYVTGTPWNTRPVVAYVGARDGMLHAIFVARGADGGTWTADGKTLPPNIVAGTELWAMIPPGQLCGLLSNDAMVDASVNVIDVMASFPNDANNDGVIDWGVTAERPTGIRTWRTVLLATTAAGSELFALDVTNPLKPVLLWHVGGATEKDGRWDRDENGVFDPTGSDTLDVSKPNTYAVVWTDTTDPSTGLSAENGHSSHKSGRFDYRNLGLSYGTAVGRIWEGNAFRYVAYLATSTVDYGVTPPEGFRGIEVFALDLVTGQKLWQWQRRYARKNGAGDVIADNAIPGRPALADTNADGTVDRVYVGDMEGHLWELDAKLGGNLNVLPSTTSTSGSPKLYSFPLYGTPQMTATGASSGTRALFTLSGGGLAQQPLTSPIGLGRFTEVPSSPPALADHLLYRLALVQGTMGVNWSIAPYEAGRVLILPSFPEHNARIAYWNERTPVDLEAPRNPLMYGVLKPEAVWTIDLGVGERVFGMPRILNNRVIFSTAFGSFNGDISETTTDTGNLYVVKGNTSTSETINTKAFGGVLVFEDKLVITTATGMRAKDAPAGMTTTDGTAQRPFNRATPGIFKTWERPTQTPVKR